MLTNKYISIKISGTPLSKAGFIPIVNVNGADFFIYDSYPSALCTDEYYVAFSTDTDKTVYKLIYNRITATSSTFSRRLVVAFSVPNGYALPAEVRPYDLLVEIANTFLEQNTAPNQSRPGYREFKAGRIDTTALEQISQKYPLTVSVWGRYTNSAGNERAAINAPIDRFNDILLRAADPEYDKYSEVVVGANINNLIIRNSVKTVEQEPTPDPKEPDSVTAEEIPIAYDEESETGTPAEDVPETDSVADTYDEDNGIGSAPVRKKTGKRIILILLLLVILIAALAFVIFKAVGLDVNSN